MPEIAVLRSKLAAAEARAEIAEARLKAAIDAMPEGVVFLDAEGRYITWNARYAELYHRSADLFRPGGLLADALRVGVARGDYPEAVGREEAWLKDRLQRLANADGARSEQRLADGRWILVEERRTADGGVIGLRIDITEMKQQAAALEQAAVRADAANRAKSEFLANMSHEIRTPLNGVMGIAGALARTDLAPEQAEMVSLIETSAQTLEALLTDILDLARIEAGKIELRPEPFDLANCVNACACLFEASARAKNLTFIVHIDSQARGTFEGDAPRIRQILSNLLGNAVKFTATGEVRLTVRGRRDETTTHLAFEVADTGIGFDQETKQRLFGRFEQADGSITRRFGGTGLGLAISSSLAEAMGGRLTADGVSGQGATFTLYLDLPRCKGALEVWGDHEADAEEAVALEAMRVLLAEDHPTNRRVVELILAAAGVDVICVENGAQAVDEARRTPYDLILMDMQMPIMDGLTAIRLIRQAEAREGCASAPIYTLTANAMPEHAEASSAAGACGHITKPITADALLGVVQYVARTTQVKARDRCAGLAGVS